MIETDIQTLGEKLRVMRGAGGREEGREREREKDRGKDSHQRVLGRFDSIMND